MLKTFFRFTNAFALGGVFFAERKRSLLDVHITKDQKWQINWQGNFKVEKTKAK